MANDIPNPTDVAPSNWTAIVSSILSEESIDIIVGKIGGSSIGGFQTSGVSQEIVGDDPNRRILVVCNNGLQDAFLAWDQDAIDDVGICLHSKESRTFAFRMVRGTLNVIASAGMPKISWQEFS